MALSGSFYKNIGSHWRLQVEWSGSQSIDGNYTDITSNFYWIGLDGYSQVNAGSTRSGYQTINGDQTGFSATSGLSAGQKKLLQSKTTRVYHDADGSKQTSIHANYDLAVTLSNVYYGVQDLDSGTITLDTIPRASSLTSGCDWTAGTQNLAVTINRAVTNFTHSVEVRVQKPDGTWVYIGARDNIATSTTFTFSLDENTLIYQAISQYENRPSWVRVITYNGSTMLGYKDYYGLVYGAGIAKISFANFNIGDNIPATVTGMQNYTGFQYTAVMTFGSFSKTWTLTPSNTKPTLDFTSTEIQTLYAQIPNANSGIGSVSVTSKYNGVDINDGLPAPEYDPVFNFTANVTNSNPIFNAGSIAYADTNATTKGFTGNNQYIIQNQSDLTAYVNTKATAQNGATFTKYVVTINGQQKEITTATGNVLVGKITAGTDQTLTVTAYDSRGNSTSLTLTVTVIPHSVPTLSITLERQNKFENATSLKVSGSFSKLTVGGADKNTILTLVYRYKEKGASSFGSDQPMIFTASNGAFTATTAILNLDNTKAFDFEVTVSDKIASTTNPASVGAGQPLFFIDSKKMSVGLGKFPQGNNTFETVGDVIVGGALSSGNASISGTLSTTGNATIGGNLTIGSNKPILITSSNGSSIEKQNVDFNTITETGIYNVNSVTNSPPKSSVNPDKWFHVVVSKRQDPTDGGKFWVIQTAWDFRDGVYHRRGWINNGSQAWDKWRRFGDDRRLLSQLYQDGQGISANTWTRVDFNPVINDAGMYNDSINMFTVPEEGWYEISSSMKLNISVNTAVDLQIWGNASPTSIFSYQMSNNGWNFMYGSNVVYLNTGTNYEFVIQHNDGGYTRNIYSGKATIKRI